MSDQSHTGSAPAPSADHVVAAPGSLTETAGWVVWAEPAGTLVAMSVAAGLLWRDLILAGVVVELLLLLWLLAGARLGRQRPRLTLPLAAVVTLTVTIQALPWPIHSTPGRTVALAGLTTLTLLLAGPWRRSDTTAGRAGRVWAQLLVTAAGAGAGVVAYLVVRPDAPRTGLPAATLALAVAFGAVIEEWLWRGLLAPATYAVLGPWSFVFDAGLYASFYALSRSAGLVLLAFIVGAGASWVRTRSGRMWGLVLGHALGSVLGLVVLPLR